MSQKLPPRTGILIGIAVLLIFGGIMEKTLNDLSILEERGVEVMANYEMTVERTGSKRDNTYINYSYDGKDYTKKIVWVEDKEKIQEFERTSKIPVLVDPENPSKVAYINLEPRRWQMKLGLSFVGFFLIMLIISWFMVKSE